MRKFEITYPGWQQIIMGIKEDTYIGELRTELNFEYSWVSILVDMLVEKKFVNKTTDSKNKRVKFLSLTLKGKELQDCLIKARKLTTEEVITG